MKSVKHNKTLKSSTTSHIIIILHAHGLFLLRIAICFKFYYICSRNSAKNQNFAFHSSL